MDSSLLFEQLEWAFLPDLLEGKSAEAQQETQKVHSILSDALDDAFQQGQDNEKDRHQWS